MPLKTSRSGESSDPNVPAWILEPEQVTGLQSNAANRGQMSPLQTPSHLQTPFNLQPHSTGHTQQQIPQIQKRVAFEGPSQWPEGGNPPMAQKRKDKNDKKNKKKDKKKNLQISGPLGKVLHVGMQDIAHLDHTGPVQAQSNFTVEHLATMPVDGQLSHISPYESIRRVRDLVKQGNLYTQEIILVMTPTEIIIKDGSTRNSLNVIPLGSIVNCNFIQDSGGNVLMVASQANSTSQPKLYFFQSAMASAESICGEIKQKVNQYKSLHEEEMKQRIKGKQHGNQSVPILGENWILGARPNSPPSNLSLPPHPQSLPPAPPLQPPPPTMSPGAQANYSPAPPAAGGSRNTPLTNAGSNTQLAASNSSQNMDHIRDDVSVSSTQSHQRRPSDVVNKPSSKYASNVLASSKNKGVEFEIKRTMKASRIQRDVDIINHVLSDLEEFMTLLKEKAIAWNDLEKKSKKSKRRKHDAALEALRKKAEPPTEQEFLLAYQRCKYGVNVIAKLGHHLSSPTPGELLKGIFQYIQEMVNLNKGTQLVSGVISPLFTKAAVELMTRKLTSTKEKDLWNQLGGNWFITSDQWPSSRPLPPDYEIEFTDGCIPPNLHNSSDCPSNFPTLDTLPREQRHPDYSEAYDGGEQQEGEKMGAGLMISPAVMAAVSSKATVVNSPISAPTGGRRSSETAMQPGGLSATRSQQSLNSASSLESDGKYAKALFDYQAASLEELSIRRSEKLEVLDDSLNWWKVKNILGSSGYVPSNLVEVIMKRRKSKPDSHQPDDLINLHGRNIPAPPKISPPPVPSTANVRRPSITTGNKHGTAQSPQIHGRSRKLSQQPQNLFTVPEVSESRTSTVSRAQHPPLPPPPTFSPAPPGQTSKRMASASVPPAPPMVPGAPPPPGGGPPVPPPPPPVEAPKVQMSFSEMLSQHKLYSSKSQKKHLQLKEGQIDIAAALKKRKPLRKTTTAMSLEGVADSIASGPTGLAGDLQNALKSRQGQDSTDNKGKELYAILPWKANLEETKKWLKSQGYESCVGRVVCKSGEELYEKGREDLREMLGLSDGIRLFSQLQKDKSRAQKEAGAVKESEFQKLMRERKTAADVDGEPGLLKGGWGKNRSADGGENQPPWRQNLRSFDKETILDDTGPRRGRYQAARRGGGNNTMDSSRRRNRQSVTYSDDERDRRGRRTSGERSQNRRRDRKYSDDYDGDRHGSGRRSKKSSAYSDDEGYRSRRRKGRRRDSTSDYDSDDDRRRGRKGHSKRRGPTNIDDFDEDDYSSSDSYSSDYSDYSGSDSEYGGRRIRSSASASDLTNATWALSGSDGTVKNIPGRIKMQQAEIKKQLGALSQLQKRTGTNPLAPQQQKLLQQDLQKLEQLQTKLSYKQGDQSLQMQLLGQQMLLWEHLKEAQQSIMGRSAIPGMMAGPTGNMRLQMLQQQQQVLAEQQRQILFEEQQRQMMMAAQMASMPPAGFMSPQQSFGMAAVPQLYSPYSATVGYF